MSDKIINFIDLQAQYKILKDDIDQSISNVLNHSKYIMGPEVSELEDILADYTGANNCISVASGTEALLISLMALGVDRYSEIITTPFTFISTVEVIALLGAKPVFVDIDIETANIDVNQIEEKITSKTKAIIPVSLYGQPSDMQEINLIAEKYGIPVIEDAAQSFGSEYQGNKSCNLSTIGCTSFFPSKPLGCYGDGGAIFTSDDSIAKKCKEIRVHGQSKRYFHTSIGVGGRMDTIQCAILLAKFPIFEDEVLKRIQIGGKYNREFDKAGIVRILQRNDRTSVFAQYTILSDHRDEYVARLSAAGIPTAIHYPLPLNLQPAYKELCCPDCTPNSNKLANSVLSIPMGPYLQDEDQDFIIEKVISLK